MPGTGDKRETSMDLLHDMLWQAVEKHGHRIAFDTLQGTLTYRQLAERIDNTAAGLQNLGVGQGERIAILAPNCIDYIVYHYAASKLGAILVVLNTRHANPELAYAINDAEAAALVIHEDCATHLEALEEQCDSVKIVISIGNVPGADINTNKLAAMPLKPQPVPNQKPDDPVLLIYTSGTTGKPKGALQTHKGIAYIDKASADAFQTTENDVYLAFLPYFHQAGLARTRSVLINGGTILITPKMDAEQLAHCMVEKQVSITNLLPPVDGRLIEIAERDGLEFTRLRLILGGGGLGPLHAKHMATFCNKTGCGYIGIYGQTEVTGPATLIKDVDYFERPDSCGKPLNGTEVAIWSDHATPANITLANTGEPGEIMVRSPGCVPGYWRNDAATTALYNGEWLHTGDLGSLDEDGWLHFLGRKKELIKTGGENVYPKEVEDVLWHHPNIQDMTILGLPDPNGWGEKVAALITPKNGQDLTLEEIKEFCQDKIAGYKIPKVIKCVAQIPRNFAGKPAKHKLVELFNDE